MDMIKSIEINKVKGIDNLKLELDLIPNKPSIFVAPNGFGKSSITMAFDSISATKLNISKEYWHNAKENKDCFVKIVEISDKTEIELIANTSTNTISTKFDIQVINNKVTSEAKMMNINGLNIPKANKVVKDIVLINSIPEKIYLDYSVTKFRERYKLNKYIIPNLEKLASSKNFILGLWKCKKNLDNILRKRRINEYITELEEDFQKSIIKQNDFNYKYDNFNLINKILEDCDIKPIIKIYNKLFDPLVDVNKVIYIIQIINIYKNNKEKFPKVYKRALYEKRKKSLEDLINSIDRKKRIVSITEQKGKLVVKFIKANMISNGEIDLICFLIYLEKIKYSEIHKDLILIIDEVFDYLDDANIIIVQKYISSFIKNFSLNERKIYPIIMTHLDPNVFKNYYFAKMKVYYLNDFNIKIDSEVKKIITDRKNLTDDEQIDYIGKYYLHFHNENCDLSDLFKKRGLSDKYNSSEKFKIRADEEMQKYINDEKSDYLLVLCSLRINIEEYIYYKLDDKYKLSFLEEKKTINKILYAENTGLEIPENFQLLSALYNDFLHLDKSTDPQNKKILFLASKLDNIFIKDMIKSTIISIKEQNPNFVAK